MITTYSSPRRAASALRVGILALTDAAPFVVAHELGFFARQHLRVELHREIGWATIREKIIYGELDAAQAPAPMAWSAQLGLGCAPRDVVTALVTSVNGNAITLSRTLWDAGVRDVATLREHARARRARAPLTFGVVFRYSSHHLMLREWLQRAGFDPEHDVRIVVVPPAQMFRNLAAGTIDGFCAGEPWNTVAVREAIGWCPAWSNTLQPGHVEKVLLVTQDFASTRGPEHTALVRAVSHAAAWCDEPANRSPLAELLADARYLNVPARVIAPSLLGRFDGGNERIESVPDFHVFHRADAGVPTAARAAKIQTALAEAGLLPADRPLDATLPGRIFREDLHHEILQPHHLPHEIAS